MLVNLINKTVSNTILLAHPILVEFGVLTAKFIFRSLTIVSSNVVYNAREHVRVLRTWSDGWPHSRSKTLHQPSTNTQYWHHDQEEVCSEEGNTLLGALDPHWVKMHVEFRREVVVHDSIDVLQMVATRILVRLRSFWVRFMPTSTASSHCLGNSSSLSFDENRAGTLAASHELRHEHVSRLHFYLLLIITYLKSK